MYFYVYIISTLLTLGLKLPLQSAESSAARVGPQDSSGYI